MDLLDLPIANPNANLLMNRLYFLYSISQYSVCKDKKKIKSAKDGKEKRLAQLVGALVVGRHRPTAANAWTTLYGA